MESTQTAWGFSVVSSGGTALSSLTSIVPKGIRLKVSAIAICYPVSATTADTMTVADGDNVRLFSSTGNASGVAVQFSPTVIEFPRPITVDGLRVGAAGATTGYCSIFLANE